MLIYCRLWYGELRTYLRDKGAVRGGRYADGKHPGSKYGFMIFLSRSNRKIKQSPRVIKAMK